MSAYATYQSLSGCDGWKEETPRVRWAAARYYAGVDSADELYRLAERVPVNRNFTLPPPLTIEEVRRIIRLR